MTPALWNSDASHARAVLQALRDGQVPQDSVLDLCVGREEIISSYKQLLKDITQGQAAMKFIRGPYGYGKSMLLQVFEQIACNQGFAVAKVSIRSELPFNKIEEFYRKIVREVTITRGVKCKEGIEALLQEWLRYLQKEVGQNGALDDPFDFNNAIVHMGRNQLREVRAASPAFAQGVEAYLDGVQANDLHKAKAAVIWLRQDPSQRAEDKRHIGVKGSLTKEMATEFLQAFLRFVRWVPLAGTVILVDEVEYMRNLPQARLRDAAYDNIRALWDACNNGEIKYTLFVFAATDEMFTDERRGFPSYAALSDRMGLEENQIFENPDMRWPVVDLPLLTVDQAVKLARQLLHLYSIAEDWDGSRHIRDEWLKEIAQRAAAGLLGDGIRPRELVRSTIRWFDKVKYSPQGSAEDYLTVFDDIFDKTKGEEYEEEKEPLWGSL